MNPKYVAIMKPNPSFFYENGLASKKWLDLSPTSLN